ncbi:hypothetical protein CPB85DRAFT_601316 [Mucidula mucida]|nr:hypothetical protein CPB85DRAFT_601316 [Mucidula mucida]
MYRAIRFVSHYSAQHPSLSNAEVMLVQRHHFFADEPPLEPGITFGFRSYGKVIFNGKGSEPLTESLSEEFIELFIILMQAWTFHQDGAAVPRRPDNVRMDAWSVTWARRRWRRKHTVALFKYLHIIIEPDLSVAILNEFFHVMGSGMFRVE